MPPPCGTRMPSRARSWRAFFVRRTESACGLCTRKCSAAVHRCRQSARVARCAVKGICPPGRTACRDRVMTRMDHVHPDIDKAEILQALIEGRLSDPFAVLGPHATPRGRVVRAFLPGARAVATRAEDGTLLAVLAPSTTHDGIFSGLVPGEGRYLLCIQWPDEVQETEDPYA